MAVQWNPDAGVDRTANGGYTVAPENVILKPELSGRSEETDVTELADDIEHRGQLIAGICYKDSSGWPVLIAGHRRYRAIVELNRRRTDPIRFKFNYSQVKNEEEALDLTVAENRNRTNTNALDDSYNISIYLNKFGKGVEEVARKYFPGADSAPKLAAAVKWVSDRQKLLELSPEAQEKLRKGEFSTSAAQQLTKLQPVDQNKVIEAAGKKGKKLKVDDVKQAVEEISPVKKRKEISENSPVKLLKKFKILAEAAGGLAAENLGEDPDMEVVMDLSRSILVMCKKLGVPLFAKADSWAEENKDMETQLELQEA